MAHATSRTVGVLALLLLVLTALPVAAQTDQEKAAELYREGVDLYFAEDYGVAITKFREGYQLDPNAMFLYSLSLCFSKLNNFDEALDHAERASETGGMSEDVATKNDARLVSFALLIRSDEMVQAEIDAREEANEVPTCATNADCSEGEVCNMRRGVCVNELPAGADVEGSPLFGPLGWAGVGAGAVGIGMLVGGGVTSLSLSKKEDRLELVSDPNNADFDESERDELLDQIDSQKSLGRILVLGGAGLTVVGATLVVVDLFVLKDDDSKESARLVPLFLPDGGGLTFSLTFD